MPSGNSPKWDCKGTKVFEKCKIFYKILIKKQKKRKKHRIRKKRKKHRMQKKQKKYKMQKKAQNAGKAEKAINAKTPAMQKSRIPGNQKANVCLHEKIILQSKADPGVIKKKTPVFSGDYPADSGTAIPRHMLRTLLPGRQSRVCP